MFHSKAAQSHRFLAIAVFLAVIPTVTYAETEAASLPKCGKNLQVTDLRNPSMEYSAGTAEDNYKAECASKVYYTIGAYHYLSTWDGKALILRRTDGKKYITCKILSPYQKCELQPR